VSAQPHAQLPARAARASVLALLGVVTVLAVPAAGRFVNGPSLPWPDWAVRAAWPTFTSIPLAPTGEGDSTIWNGAFSGCRPSPRLSSDFACTYVGPDAHRGYVCVAPPGPTLALTAAALTARVAPGDKTYRTAKPAQVCDSALALRLEQG
jgi:hypothetical protein